MFFSEITFSVNTLLDYITTKHLIVVFICILIFAFIFSMAILFHFNKYRYHSLGNILVGIIYIIGISLLLILAFIFLILFSK